MGTNPSIGRAPTAATTNAQDEIRKLEETRNEAVLHGDVSALDRMTSDDYTFITLHGEMRTKQEILKGSHRDRSITTRGRSSISKCVYMAKGHL